MTERMDTEALRALVAAKDMHDDRGVLCVTSEHDDQSWGMSISICEPFDTDKIVKSLAAEVLEFRAEAEQAKAELAAAKQAVQHANDHADAAIAELAAEKALADRLEALLPEPLEGVDEYAAPEMTEWDAAIADARATYRKARGL